MAEFAAGSYQGGRGDIKGYKLDLDLSTKDGQVYTRATDGTALADAPNLVVAFRGTKYAKDWLQNASAAVGFADSNDWYKRDEDLYKRATAKYPGSVAVTGHSAGGLIASELSKKYGVEAFSFNPHIPLLNAKDFAAPKNHVFVSGSDPVSALSALLPKSKVYHVKAKGRGIKAQHSMDNFLGAPSHRFL
jgi:hypothetical protein